MAVTGAFLVLFLVFHMYGNLKMYAGPVAFNEYAEHLRELGEPILPYSGFLWLFRVALLAAIAGHMYSAFSLWSRARGARSSRYAKSKKVQQTYASRTMRWGGIIVLLFIIFHLLQFTTKTIEVGGDYNAVEPYDMVIFGFSNVFVVLFYALAVLAVGFHLRHGVWSATQTLGLTSQRNQAAVSMVASLIAIVVTVGFLTVPFSVLFGILD